MRALILRIIARDLLEQMADLTNERDHLLRERSLLVAQLFERGQHGESI
jgi:hypothetical protein